MAGPESGAAEAVKTVEAVKKLEAGGLAAFPTETVWGLAARAESELGVEGLRIWKGRSSDQPVALMVSGPEVLEDYGFELSDAAHALMAAFWPGALTLVMPCSHHFPVGIARNDGAVGVRCSSHPAAAALVCSAWEAGIGPLTATSLNQSGAPPARTRAEAAKLCDGVGRGCAPLLLESEVDAGGELPSTVVDLTKRLPAVLRRGGLDLEPLSWLAQRGLQPKGDGERG
jgi:L-threonylcarbamoyladenylate synthase